VVDVPVPDLLGIADGTTLRDRFGGAAITVKNGSVRISLAARQSAMYGP
jgi:hypothetical protein